MTLAVHESHMGVEKSLQRAKNIMFWPRMTSDITDFVLKCNIAPTWPVHILSYSLAGARLPVNISY